MCIAHLRVSFCFWPWVLSVYLPVYLPVCLDQLLGAGVTRLLRGQVGKEDIYIHVYVLFM